ncbi:hypothetical protein GGX14DRAFT_651065 [Mycena pura]|uniref:GATA-type domain-containing protein n=1 Tax=Mycena pura TaxID=153505 RepID=A0AAD6YNK5_9AGAR|nr:hypothetical protein GGX14DRAFT_651065 [Mycena pura]
MQKLENDNAATPTALPRSPRLSPNVYFLSELEDDVMDGHQAVAPAFGGSTNSNNGSSSSAETDFFEQHGLRVTLRLHVVPPATPPPLPRPPLPARGAGGPHDVLSSVCVPASASVRLPAVQQQQPTKSSNSAPGGVKADCSNCGATPTPLWRRGLNDELNCNACGLYCKLHKRPRSKTMSNSGTGGEGRGQSVRSETVDVMAQCYDCYTTATPLWRKDDEGKTVCNACGLYYKLHGSARPISMKSDVTTTATPLWRKDDDGKTVCNACGLYYKLHGSARPISMKSDVVRKRSRHHARRGGASVISPILAPYSSTNSMTFEATASELSSALGPSQKPAGFGNRYPYHEAYPDALPFASVDVRSELDARANKRRRMSVDSASEPPSSATSYSSYADSYNAVSTPASSHVSGDFPFSRFTAMSYSEGGRTDGNGSSTNGGFEAGLAGLPPPADAPDVRRGASELHAPSDDAAPQLPSQGRWGVFPHPPMLPSDHSHLMGMGMMNVHPAMMYEDVYDATGNMHF